MITYQRELQEKKNHANITPINPHKNRNEKITNLKNLVIIATNK